MICSKKKIIAVIWNKSSIISFLFLFLMTNRMLWNSNAVRTRLATGIQKSIPSFSYEYCNAAKAVSLNKWLGLYVSTCLSCHFLNVNICIVYVFFTIPSRDMFCKVIRYFKLLMTAPQSVKWICTLWLYESMETDSFVMHRSFNIWTDIIGISMQQDNKHCVVCTLFKPYSIQF